MTLDVVVFKFIDYVYNYLQNRTSKMRHYKKIVTVEKDIVYDESLPDVCKLDLYHIKKDTSDKYPIVFIIHGGGFVAGDKKYRRHLSSWFAEELGAYVINVNYGLGPKYYFPEIMKHFQKALDWVYDNAEKYNFDLDNSIITGDSAGGYFSAELCAMQDDIKMQEKFNFTPKFKFKGILLNCGIYNLDKALSVKMPFNLTNSVCKSFTGIGIDKLKKYEFIHEISPVEHVTKNFPKTCIVYSEKDILCNGQGQDFIEKLKEKNVYYEEYHSSKMLDNHTFPSIWKGKAAVEANNLYISFAKRLFENKI